jgi:hypothetical protein
MALITIAGASIPNWEGGSDVVLRIYPLSSFQAADGTLEMQGTPGDDEAASSNFYIPVACTLSGTTLSIASCTLESTADSLDNPAARYGAFFYTNEGEKIAPFGQFASFVLPASPTSTTWDAVDQAQQGTL